MDKPQKNLSFTLIMAIIGFMIAIQFQTIKKPVDRDTRDIWEIREDLLKEKELESALLSEIRSNEEKLTAYESKHKQSKEQVLKETLNELKVEAGLTKVTDPGITLKIEPALEEIELGAPVTREVPPDLLQRLLNELNMYEAKFVSIDGQRVINTTVIRDINGQTKIDGHTINSLPIEVKVVVDSIDTAEKLYNRMKVSKSIEEFYVENLRLIVSSPKTKVTVPAYENPIRIRYMEPVKGNEGGNH
ncbi:NgoFVII family restriction endonuclease [Bacillus sp. MUM 116]|uniref:DUF881 domain-containing protein n=1 Tax=Bacillus sp. MUM 116 TaxID=1678002 RepID=UPI0008F5851D|nr:DUF881 domain-containing protein [Bacillus sp. MUM 116]OIK14027.1 NgoFVII family restriction endonuclease [Bacillus sp. MUM 116]